MVAYLLIYIQLLLTSICVVMNHIVDEDEPDTQPEPGARAETTVDCGSAK